MRDRMRMPKGLTQDQAFFWRYAGWSYNPSKGETRAQGRLNCAHSLAAAEQHARSERWYYEWVQDDSPDVSWMDTKQKREYREGKLQMLGCILRNSNDETLGSLWGISVYGRGDTNCRVVEAELASEAIL